MGPRTQAETAEMEAADWHRRLGTRSISTQAIHDFFAWRSDPVCAEAYRQVEADWDAAKRTGPVAPHRPAQGRATLRPATIAALATGFFGGVIAARIADRIRSR